MTFKEPILDNKGFRIQLDNAKEMYYFNEYTFTHSEYATDIVQHLNKEIPSNDSNWGVIYQSIPNSGSMMAIVFIDALSDYLFHEMRNAIIAYLKSYEVIRINS